MNDYVIGSGALLSAGPAATISGATLHAQTDPALAAQVKAALVDFEAPSVGELSRLVILAAGWNGRQFTTGVVAPLLAQGHCSLADILARLAEATGVQEVHVFARWIPDDGLCGDLGHRGVRLVSHPIDAIERAALICGQTYSGWNAPLRAA